MQHATHSEAVHQGNLRKIDEAARFAHWLRYGNAPTVADNKPGED